MPPAAAAGSMEMDEVVVGLLSVLVSVLLSVLLVVPVASLADVVPVEILEVSVAVSVVDSEVDVDVVVSDIDGQYVYNKEKEGIDIPARRSSMPLPKIISYGSGEADAIVPRNKMMHSTVKMKDRMAMGACGLSWIIESRRFKNNGMR